MSRSWLAYRKRVSRGVVHGVLDITIVSKRQTTVYYCFLE